MTSTPKKVPIPKNGVDYRGKVVLAPMVRSGELPSRLLALKYGADLVWGPETVDKSMIGTTKSFDEATKTIIYTRFSNSKLPKELQKESIIYRLHPEKERKKLIFQIGTASPELAVEAAKLVAPEVAGIDVNAGCPKPFSTSGGMGAALLQTPDLLASILEALVKEIGQVYEIGISVKIRLLETPEKTEALVRKLCSTGITGLTIHCRTTPMRPRERAIRDQLRMIGNLCREAGVACLMNGDVTNRDEALELAEEYGVDGGMIATAAEKNSSVFLSAKDGGPKQWREVVLEYIKTAIEVENRWGNTKFLLAQLLPGKAEEQKQCQQARTYQDIVKLFKLTEWEERAEALDEKLGITIQARNVIESVKRKAKDEQNAAKRANKKAKKQEARQDVRQRPHEQEEENDNDQHTLEQSAVAVLAQ
jgi:tRNA-dihydrouridine synthase 2